MGPLEKFVQQGRRGFGIRSVHTVRENDKAPTPACASPSGKARERRWRVFPTVPSSDQGNPTHDNRL